MIKMKTAREAKAEKANKAACRMQAAEKAGLKRLFYALAAVLLLVLAAVVWVAFGPDEPAATGADSQTESRKLYIGDLITLEIASERLTSQAIQELFSDFEIVELQQDRGRFLVTLRTFEPGEYRVPIGSKEVVIQVASTLDDIERNDVFEGGDAVLAPGFFIPWRSLFFAALGVFAVSGGTLLVKRLIRRQEERLSPYQFFRKKAFALDLGSKSYFVDLTLLFKRYLESMYQFRIIGKTSAEIAAELSRLRSLDSLLPKIEAWLGECDRFKFSGMEITRQEKEAHFKKLMGIAERIDQQQQQPDVQHGAGRKEGAG